MPWIPEEEIKRAREITAIEYLKKYQPNRLKKSSARNEWELTDHDSFKINEQTSQWHWKSRDIGGTSALNFLIHVDGCSFLEAVQMLKDEYPTYIPPPVEAKSKEAICPAYGQPRLPQGVPLSERAGHQWRGLTAVCSFGNLI